MSDREYISESMRRLVDRYSLWLDMREEVLAKLHQYASECGDCAGTRVCPDDEPCTACADVWAVIDRAEGRA